MESVAKTPPQTHVSGPDSSSEPGSATHDPTPPAELESLRSTSAATEEESLRLGRRCDEAAARNGHLKSVIAKLTSERDSLAERIDEEARENEALRRELELCRERIDELSREHDSLRRQVGELDSSLTGKEELGKRIDDEAKEKLELRNQVEALKEETEKWERESREKNDFLLKSLDSLRRVKEGLVMIIDIVDVERVDGDVDAKDSGEAGVGMELDEDLRVFSEELTAVARLADEAEVKVAEYKAMKKKEKKELENSVVSLTEENRDINNLLRIALVEKEAVEKSLNKLKGGEQKRTALLQIAERGLQRVGFGFMMGGGTTEQPLETSGASTASTKSDSSECEEEVVSLASTVERIMKNLRLEITQLRRSLEESRSDNERLQSLTEKQAQKIEENTIYINELEERERILSQNVEELLREIKETEAEVARWREACELEVEAGKREIQERDKVVAILKQELEKTKSALDISNGKLKLKEELASAAMAAQEAAEKSLQLADSRAAGLRERIEELTRQLEEADKRERNSRHRVRHICWPWRILKMNLSNNSNTRVRNVKQMLPEMQALLHYKM